ncbi:hypothetical protein FEK35_27230 [Nocardia cyriacigeorgica]|uniref:Uncharacterized protein n=1 Tax=Nocardia cyriacigeorgica TaxID=135487 RepID=A0A5R8P631_9NOCA|nr:hypothetical protein [Nocardia cyriacigeorgica]TLF96787.1 hypothetical protein FEK35_27230 [Nocardia cyriacigeorgica]
MPDHTIERTPLQQALADAIALAELHGFEHRIVPEDFGIQRSASGITNATFIDSDVAITVLVDRHGRTTIGLAALEWIHFPDPDREPSADDCGICCDSPLSPTRTVYLPGDDPRAAYRDDRGDIRRRRDDLYIAGPGDTREQLEQRRARYDGNGTHYANAMRELYAAAIELLTKEATNA